MPAPVSSNPLEHLAARLIFVTASGGLICDRLPKLRHELNQLRQSNFGGSALCPRNPSPSETQEIAMAQYSIRLSTILLASVLAMPIFAQAAGAHQQSAVEKQIACLTTRLCVP
jgi:hypothetical protein